VAKKKSRGTLIQQSRRVSSAQKAQYHEIDGAGRSHVKRPFFALNDADDAAIYKRLSDGVDELMRRSR